MINIDTIFQSSDPDAVFSALLPQLGETLDCDRCFLYLRNPYTRMGTVPYCWRRSSKFPEILDAGWKPEPESLVKADPMFAAAVRAEPSIYVNDVDIASSDLLNREFERENFGHRSLIHAHLRHDGQLWGILQPCTFDQPKTWTDGDRAIITQLEARLTPLAIAYVKAKGV